MAAADLSEVAYASLFMHRQAYLTELEGWYCVGLEEQRADFAKPQGYQEVIFKQRRAERIKIASDHLGISSDKVTFVEHHLAHLTAAYYTAPNIAPKQKLSNLNLDFQIAFPTALLRVAEM